MKKEVSGKVMLSPTGREFSRRGLKDSLGMALQFIQCGGQSMAEHNSNLVVQLTSSVLMLPFSPLGLALSFIQRSTELKSPFVFMRFSTKLKGGLTEQAKGLWSRRTPRGKGRKFQKIPQNQSISCLPLFLALPLLPWLLSK